MEFFFKPKGIAIIGASANPTKGGHFILNNVMKGFNAGVYPVNPGYSDITEGDILEYLIDDADTGVIGLYLESIPDGQKFIDLCRRSEKPIVVLRGGKSRKGAEAAMSHTASLAGNGAVISGALTQAGAVEAHDFKQMMDLCRSLANYPDIAAKDSRRVAILTMSGAAGIVSADFIEEHGLAVAELSAGTVEALKEIYPGWMPVSNPVDLWPAVERHGRKKAYTKALELIGRLKTQTLLNGFRGFAAVDRDALADILVRIGELGRTYPQIKEIDVNPLIVSEGKPIAVDATIIIEG